MRVLPSIRPARAPGWKDPLGVPAPGVFIFDLFTPRFCQRLLQVTDQFEPDEPNTMNKYGLTLADVGMDHFSRSLLQDVVVPLARKWFPEVGRLQGHHGFLVDYEPGKQRSLNYHKDESLITLNVCLGRNWSGGKLVFRIGRQKYAVDHFPGQAILHSGELEHRAEPVKRGRRTNLILWCKRTAYK